MYAQRDALHLHPKTSQPTNCAWNPVNFKCKWIFHPYKLSHIVLQSKKPNRINKNKKEHDMFIPPFSVQICIMIPK